LPVRHLNCVVGSFVPAFDFRWSTIGRRHV
jgi:hypothetical protein